jgi:hypothetical protein
VDAAYNTTQLEAVALKLYFGGRESSFLLEDPDPCSVTSSPFNNGILDSVDLYMSKLDLLYTNALSSINASLAPIDFMKITINLCIHTFRTVIANGSTTTTLLHSSPALTKDPRWKWTPGVGLPTYRGCGKAGTISACLAQLNLYGSTSILDYLSADILTSKLIWEDPVLSSLYDNFYEKNANELIAARMKNVAVSMSNGYVIINTVLAQEFHRTDQYQQHATFAA